MTYLNDTALRRIIKASRFHPFRPRLSLAGAVEGVKMLADKETTQRVNERLYEYEEEIDGLKKALYGESSPATTDKEAVVKINQMLSRHLDDEFSDDSLFIMNLQTVLSDHFNR
jgi:hypothetical protein